MLGIMAVDEGLQRSRAEAGGDIERPGHHAPRGFRNLAALPQAGLDVTLPFFFRRVTGFWRDRPGAPPVAANDGTLLREAAAHGIPTVTWIGHATVLVQMDQVSFLTDPTWSHTASPFTFLGPRRFAPPGLAFETLPKIDFVLISHNHYDHLDVPTVRRLAATGARVLVPLKVGALLRRAGVARVDELDWWETRRLGPLTVHCVPSQHWSGRGLVDQSLTLWGGWAVMGRSERFYFAGDTGYFPGFAEIGSRLGPFGLAALPIGAYEPQAMMRPVHLNPEEALQAGLDVGARVMVGMHYGTFDLTDEPLDEPPRRLHAEARRVGRAAETVWTPALGDTRRW